MHEFTVEQILNAAEQNKYKNFNEDFIEYYNGKVIAACVIGEAFLNLGLVENGTEAKALSDALVAVKPDDGQINLTVQGQDWYRGKFDDEKIYTDLAYFINDLNGRNGYRGKKRLVALARKYFSKSLKQVVRF